MTDILFGLLVGLILLIPQQLIRFDLFGVPFELGLITLFVVYVGFVFTWARGLVVVILLSYVTEVFSFVPPGFMIVSHLVLFVSLQLLSDQILAESYVTKMIWTFIFYLFSEGLALSAFERGSLTSQGIFFWGQKILQAGLASLTSIPFFMILDSSLAKWRGWLTPPRPYLTGADLFQVKSPQRKYLR